LLNYLKNINIREDLLITLIYEILDEQDMLPFNGYIGVDYPNLLRKQDNMNTIEYVIFNPRSHLKLLGIYHYDFIDSKYRFFMHKQNWFKYYESKIVEYIEIYKKFKHNRNNTCKSLFTLFALDDNMVQNKLEDCSNFNKVYFDIFNYNNIDDAYIKNLYLICGEIGNYNKFDFWSARNMNTIMEFDMYGNYDSVELY
jgi:hypothetical protein